MSSGERMKGKVQKGRTERKEREREASENGVLLHTIVCWKKGVATS